MPAERYYYPGILQTDSEIVLDGQEFHHLSRVMRTQRGDEVEVVNGQGQLATALVKALDKKQAALLIKAVESKPPESKLILSQGIPRLNRLEFIIEKGTELGATEIWLFPAVRSEKKEFSPNQVDRLASIAIAAMKQSGRLFLPKISIVAPLKKWGKIPSITGFFGDLRQGAPSLLAYYADNPPQKDVLFCVGPEGGLSDEEIAILESFHFSGVKLHPNILRTDTAALASLCLLAHFTTYKKE